MNKVTNYFICLVLVVISCNPDNGYEYMPNMYRSPSIESYGMNNFFKDSLNAREPVQGTIARGHLSSFKFDNTLQGYFMAGDNAVNPIEANDKNYMDGGRLYSMFCKHCHGEDGAGGGTITHPIYSAVPHYNDTKVKRRCDLPMAELKPGHIFHAITYGLNAMGPHASQLSEEERWKIVLYVEKLQNYNVE